MASLGELTIDFGIRDNAASKSIQEQLRSVILLGDAADKTGEKLREMAPDDGDLQYYKRFKGEMEKIVQTWEKIEGLENGRGSVRKTKKAIGKLMPLTHGFSKGEALESIKESETAINNIIAKNKELEKVEQEEQAKAKEALDAINKKLTKPQTRLKSTTSSSSTRAAR